MKNCSCSSKEEGAVLFVALIALVVMMLGVMAMYRSIDSSTGVAGNIGFRQQGVAVTDTGVEFAINWLSTAGNLEAHSAADGYYATQSFGLTNDDILTIDWDVAARKLADQNGYQIWMVIHRLCNQLGPPTLGGCPDSGNTINQASIKPEEKLATGGLAPLYRITIRTLGPRRSESIVQVISY